MGLIASRRAYGRLGVGYERRRTFQNPAVTVRVGNVYPSVKAVVPQENYVLYITFANGETGTLDMKPYLDFGVFKRIRNAAKQYA